MCLREGPTLHTSSVSSYNDDSAATSGDGTCAGATSVDRVVSNSSEGQTSVDRVVSESSSTGPEFPFAISLINCVFAALRYQCYRNAAANSCLCH